MATAKKVAKKQSAGKRKSPPVTDQLATKLMILFVILSFIFLGMATLYYA